MTIVCNYEDSFHTAIITANKSMGFDPIHLILFLIVSSQHYFINILTLFQQFLNPYSPLSKHFLCTISTLPNLNFVQLGPKLSQGFGPKMNTKLTLKPPPTTHHHHHHPPKTFRRVLGIGGG